MQAPNFQSFKLLLYTRIQIVPLKIFRAEGLMAFVFTAWNSYDQECRQGESGKWKGVDHRRIP